MESCHQTHVDSPCPFPEDTQMALETPQDVDDDSCIVAEIGDEEETTPVTHDQTVSDTKRRQNVLFQTWFAKKIETITKETVTKVMKAEDEEILSIRSLMARQESQAIISNPREYQMELFEKAKKSNVIAVLDTGSGKTLIAVMLLRYMIDKELDAREMGNPPRISFFLVDKVALVFQQYAVLRANLDQNIERFCGAMGCDLWSREIWLKHFAANMIIVCTAEILVQCLAHSFLTIQQINLLIFDEAHHAKKGHAYARVIKDFYLTQGDLNKRPRIFGMTASPVDVDSKDDFREKANELEILLHSQIVTTSNWTSLAQSIHRPELLFVSYAPLRQPSETVLYRKLWAQYRDLPGFCQLFNNAKDITNLLGCWCSDVYWSFAFSERVARKMENKAQVREQRENDVTSLEVLDTEIASLKEAHNDIQQYSFGKPNLTLDDLTTKVLKLHALLQLIFATPSEARCLVFVEKRYTARLLKALFDHIGGPHMKVGFLTGANSSSLDGIHYSIKQQVVTLLKFRRGDLNCLFATSVAEEGLDIQDCGYVIRFDPCRTMIQYIQSRGRARQKNSKFFHLIETNNMMEKDHLDSLRRAENVMRQFCQSLPEDRRLKGEDANNMNLLETKRSHRVYKEPSTGATLTYDFSLVVLAHFVGCLPRDDEDDLSINYVLSVRAGKFVYEVILPPQSPIRSAIGREASQKAIAKRSAAFEACIALRKGRYLDEYLLPIYAKKLPAMRNAILALNARSSNVYPMLAKPLMWTNGFSTVPQVLFLNIINLKQAWDRPVKPLGLLTRSLLPTLPTIPLYRTNSSMVETVIYSLTEAFEIEMNELTQLTGFTLTIFKDIFNKTFEFKEIRMSYWLAPLVDLVPDSDIIHNQPRSLIDWPMCAAVSSTPAKQWTSEMVEEDLVDKFIVDPWDGGRRLFTIGISTELHPSDPVPAGVAPGYNMNSIIQYSVKLWRKSRGKREWIEKQPVVVAEKALHRLNVLARPSEAERNMISRCFICLEPMKISSLPTGIAGMALVFPAIIHRLESYLIALEFNGLIGLDIQPQLALEALTKDSDSTDTQGERINFQHGMGPNYERLEFIGDCFLKMATSIALLARNVGNDEEQMHIKRMLMICNKNLFNNATKHEYYQFVRGLTFSRRTWYPEGLKLLAGKGAKDEIQKYSITQSLGDKTIADICEATIGAAFVSHFTSGHSPTSQMDQAVKAVSCFVANGDHDMTEWADYYRVYKMPSYQTAPSNAAQRDLAKQIEVKLGYKFKYPRLLRSAFQHPGIGRSAEGLPSYQRLEFLGDSLLDMTAVTYLFNEFPNRDPQWLTEHKMAMVSNKFLGALCVKLGFHMHLKHNDQLNQNMNFATDINEAEQQSDGARDYWTTVKDPPKCLPDIVESYVGALFVDSEFDYREVQRFFDEHIKWFFEDMSIYDTFANNHPVSKMHKLLNETMECHNYALRSNEVPSIDGHIMAGYTSAVMVHDTIIAEGRASSSRYAKIRASENALEELRYLAPYEFRTKFLCDCSSKGRKSGADLEQSRCMEEMIGTAV